MNSSSGQVNIQAVGVKIDGVTKMFFQRKSKDSGFTAVDNVTLEVEPGEMVTLLGPSGCGKTTILRMLSGFALPTQGDIYFGGRKVTDLPPNKRDVGMMFQSYALFPHLSVYENVAYGLRVNKVPKAELEQRVEHVLNLMQIEQMADRIPEQLSGGQQQRVALARAIVTEPQIMLFDEPLSNLDAKMREYMRDELRKIQQRLGITSIYVTHDQAEAMAISDKVVIMKAGRIEQIGSPYDIYTRPVNEFVAYFMGKANFVDTVVKAVSADWLETEFGGRTVRLPPNESCQFKKGEKVRCMIRPEFLHIDDIGRKDSFDALVQQASFFGTNVEYTVKIGDAVLVMTDNNLHKHTIQKPGAVIRVSLDEELVRPLKPSHETEGEWKTA